MLILSGLTVLKHNSYGFNDDGVKGIIARLKIFYNEDEKKVDYN